MTKNLKKKHLLEAVFQTSKHEDSVKHPNDKSLVKNLRMLKQQSTVGGFLFYDVALLLNKSFLW